MSERGSSTKGVVIAGTIGIVVFLIFAGMYSDSGETKSADSYYQESSNDDASPEMSEYEFKNNCIDIGTSEDYKALLRYPNRYKGTMVCLQVRFKGCIFEYSLLCGNLSFSAVGVTHPPENKL